MEQLVNDVHMYVQQYTQYVHIQKKKTIVQLKDYNDYIFGSHL